MRGVVPATLVAVVALVLSGCTMQFNQQANSPEASATPSQSPTPAESPTSEASPSPSASPSAAKLVITKLPFHLGEVGVGYLAVTLGAKGGVPPYTWSIQGGTFPAGLVLSSGGSASGKPTTAGTFSFMVQVNDSASASATGPGSIFVFRQIAFSSASGTCTGNVNTGCATTLKYTGGASKAPKVVVTQNLSLYPALPAGSTFTVNAGVVNVSIKAPFCTNYNYDPVVVTLVLVDQSPCFVGFNCKSGKFTLTIHLVNSC